MPGRLQEAATMGLSKETLHGEQVQHAERGSEHVA